MNYAWPSLIACFQNRCFNRAQTVDRYRLVNRHVFLSQILEINEIYIFGHNCEKNLADIYVLMEYHMGECK